MQYTLKFLRPCTLGVVREMARYDGATIISTTPDAQDEMACVDSAVLSGKRKPTMARWQSFGVAPMLIEERRT